MLASLLAGSVFIWARLFLVDPDLWWHLKVGESILVSHHWPTTDPYSFTVSGQPWLANEWLGDVLFAATARLGGLRALEALLIILGSSILVALYYFATLRTGNPKAAFVACAALLLLIRPSFTLRPQMFAYLFLILTLICLERFRQGKRRSIWLLPLLTLVWINTHGSWIIGLGTILAYWLGGLFDFRIGDIYAERWLEGDRRRIALVFLLCICALPLTPYGTRLSASPFEVAFSLPVNLSSGLEWQPLRFDVVNGQTFLALFLLFIALQVAFGFAWRLEELGLFIFGTILMCLHLRFMMIFVPFFVPLLASMLARWMPRYDPAEDKPIVNACLIGLTFAAILLFFPTSLDLQAAVSKQFPSAAVEYLNQHSVPEPMLNSYSFGGYLIWRRGPEHKVFIDGRGDVYERGGVFSDFMHIARIEPESSALLRTYGIRSCLIERDSPLATVLIASGNWQRVYSDSLSTLFVRKDDAPVEISATTGDHRQGLRSSLVNAE